MCDHDLQDHPHKLHSLIKARVGHARTVLILREDPPEAPVDEADFFFVDKLAIFTSMLVHTKCVPPAVSMFPGRCWCAYVCVSSRVLWSCVVGQFWR